LGTDMADLSSDSSGVDHSSTPCRAELY
jgi:hypothetical protein